MHLCGFYMISWSSLAGSVFQFVNQCIFKMNVIATMGIAFHGSATDEHIERDTDVNFEQDVFVKHKCPDKKVL